MSSKKTLKASDVFREGTPFIGRKVNFEQAYPEIEDIVVEIVETGDFEDVKFEDFHKLRNRSIYTNKNLPGEFIDCSNPVCYNGGFRIGSVIHKMISEKLTEFQDESMCQGYEGSPKGKKRHKSCIHVFYYKVRIKYKGQVGVQDATKTIGST
jgi:hypothetical protein